MTMDRPRRRPPRARRRRAPRHEPAVRASEHPRVRADLGAAWRSGAAHASFPRRMSARYAASVSRSSSWRPRAPRPCRPRRRTPRPRAPEQRAGRRDDRPVVTRGPRAAARAIRPSVWVSTADVGSTSTRNSGSISRTRTSASRWRWPPEKLRPRSSTRVSRPSASASSTSSALASSIAWRIVAVVGSRGATAPRGAGR